MHRILVIEASTKNVITVGPDAKALDVLHLAKKTNLHSFPVVKDSHLVGIVSLRDIFKIFYPYENTLSKYRPILHSWEKIYEEYEKDIFHVHIKRETLVNTTVGDIMEEEFETIYADETLGKAYRLLKSRDYRILPVISRDNKLKGVITLFDIIYFILTRISHNNNGS